MAIRMTGLASGLDTENIIKELMVSKSLKKTKIEQSKTKLEWKQEKWAELNTKLYKLYTEQVSKFRLESTFNAKKASSSNDIKASITANSTAANGSYTLQIENVATSQYLTGAKVDDSKIEGGAKLTTTLSQLDPSLVGKEITIANGNTKSTFQVRSDSTINDFVSALKNAGLNANFDAAQKRFFISGKKSGEENAYSITTQSLTDVELTTRAGVEDIVHYDKLGSASKTLVDGVFHTLSEAYEAFKTNADNVDLDDNQKLAAFKETKDYKSALDTLADVANIQKTTEAQNAATLAVKAKAYEDNKPEIAQKQKENYYDTDEDGNETIKKAYVDKFGKAYDSLSESKKAEYSSKEDYIKAQTDQLYEKAVESALASKVNEVISSAQGKVDIEAVKVNGLSGLDGFSEELIGKFGLTTFEGTSSFSKESLSNQLDSFVTTYVGVETRNNTYDGAGALNSLGITDINQGVAAGNVTGMSLISASDSKLTLNGAQLTSSSATVSVNGLTIDLKSATALGESITFTVSNDVDGIYNTVKNFISEYNSIMKEMNSLFYAKSAKGYDPLTDEEKEAMTDDQIKTWEDKIKGSLLKNDSTLSGVMTAMRQAMQTSVMVDGKSYSLSSFGITTAMDYAEGGLLHIYGDSSDGTYGDYTDKLRKAIEEDPDLVTSVLSGIGKKLQEVMADKMKSSKVSSAFTFYNDKQMQKDLTNYQSQITTWTERLQTMEDDYYSQFSAMEKAMAKLNSQTNSLSSLFG